MMQPCAEEQIELTSRVDETDSSQVPDGLSSLGKKCFMDRGIYDGMANPWSRLPTDDLSKYVFDNKYGNISQFQFGRVGLDIPRMASFYDRLRTFDQGWPRQMAQTPPMMASAGFYYDGIGDRVKTFCCGLCVRYWNSYDDPWQEHRKHSPRCRLPEIVGK